MRGFIANGRQMKLWMTVGRGDVGGCVAGAVLIACDAEFIVGGVAETKRELNAVALPQLVVGERLGMDVVDDDGFEDEIVFCEFEPDVGGEVVRPAPCQMLQFRSFRHEFDILHAIIERKLRLIAICGQHDDRIGGDGEPPFPKIAEC